MLARSAVTLHSIVDAQAILDAAFLPDNRHLALLLESRTVVFYDWRSEQRVGSLFLM
jgi:RecB family exonuclease